jgi:hypothetical protein
MDNLTNIGPYLFTFVAIVLTWLLGRRKDNADISDKLGKASDALSALYEKRIHTLEDELEPLRSLPAEVQFLKAGIDVLLKQMRRMSIIPDWTPDTGVTIVGHKNGK